MRRTYLACVGDANDPSTWSGIPYHFLDAARRGGMIDEGLNLSVNSPDWKMQRILWNAAKVVRGRRQGGFQYSTWFLERLYAPIQGKLAGSRLVSFFNFTHRVSLETRQLRSGFIST
jgi:hypothetical protein